MASDQDLMLMALAEAAKAEAEGEVPVGAVLVRGGEIIATGHNRNLLDTDPSGHAEMVVMRAAAQKLKNHRLSGCELFVTMEPCAMCAGAMMHARIARLIYGADDPKAGAVNSILQVVNHPKLNHEMLVTAGVLASECGIIVQGFFRKRRAAQKA